MTTQNPNDPSPEEKDAGIIRTTTDPNEEPAKPSRDEPEKDAKKK